jgi:hypothetical protein
MPSAKRRRIVNTHSAAEWPSDRERRLLRKGDRSDEALWIGVSGALARLLNTDEWRWGRSLRANYDRDKWAGVQLTLLRADPHGPRFLMVQEALRESVMLSAWGFVPAYCEHPRPHAYPWRSQKKIPPALSGPFWSGPHWYLRPNKGRPPRACFTVSATARTARYRKKHPEQKLKRRG